MMTRAQLQSRRDQERGYTSVEVLMAMTLFAIGAAGVIGMQRAVIQGGEDARRADMAVNIANTWAARLQRDSNFWTQPNATVPDKFDLDKTRWLKNIDTCTANNFCNPPIPAAPAAGLSPAFDSFGRDLPSGSTDAVYCVQYRLTWIVPPGVGPTYPNPMPTGLMRAEVRVYYARLERTAIGTCPVAGLPEALPAASPYHFVYATTAIRETQLR